MSLPLPILHLLLVMVVVLQEEEEKALQTNRDLNLLCARFQGVQLRYTRATTDGVHLYGSVS